MKFVLQPRLLAPPPPMEIEEGEYLCLRAARIVLVAAFQLEENFDLLIGNFLELEASAAAMATEAMVRHRHGYHEFFDSRTEINRRAVNFLSTARLYVDQLLQKIKLCAGDPSSVKATLSAYYDNQFEYRFMEALRNHVQHSGSAVHSLGVNSRWLPANERLREEHSVQALTVRRYLAEDQDFKATVLNECPEQVDFLQAGRKYLECLGNVHENVRKLSFERVEAARDSFQSAIDRYAVFAKRSSIGLSAFSTTDKASLVPIFLDWDDVRIRLSSRNSGFTNLSVRYVTSRAHGI